MKKCVMLTVLMWNFRTKRNFSSAGLFPENRSILSSDFGLSVEAFQGNCN